MGSGGIHLNQTKWSVCIGKVSSHCLIGVAQAGNNMENANSEREGEREGERAIAHSFSWKKAL